MSECCIKKLELAQQRIKDYMDDSMSDDYLKGLEAGIAEIDEVIFKTIAKVE